MSQSEYSHRKRVPKREHFLQQMDQIIPWRRWVAMITPFYPAGKRGRPPKETECMLRMYLMQICEAHKLLRKDDHVLYADSGYLGIEKREEIRQNSHLASME